MGGVGRIAVANYRYTASDEMTSITELDDDELTPGSDKWDKQV